GTGSGRGGVSNKTKVATSKSGCSKKDAPPSAGRKSPSVLKRPEGSKVLAAGNHAKNKSAASGVVAPPMLQAHGSVSAAAPTSSPRNEARRPATGHRLESSETLGGVMDQADTPVLKRLEASLALIVASSNSKKPGMNSAASRVNTSSSSSAAPRLPERPGGDGPPTLERPGSGSVPPNKVARVSSDPGRQPLSFGGGGVPDSRKNAGATKRPGAPIFARDGKVGGGRGGRAGPGAAAAGRGAVTAGSPRGRGEQAGWPGNHVAQRHTSPLPHPRYGRDLSPGGQGYPGKPTPHPAGAAASFPYNGVGSDGGARLAELRGLPPPSSTTEREAGRDGGQQQQHDAIADYGALSAASGRTWRSSSIASDDGGGSMSASVVGDSEDCGSVAGSVAGSLAGDTDGEGGGGGGGGSSVGRGRGRSRGGRRSRGGGRGGGRGS
ncbi:unnamed protein product, partial [Pylaiella littoralis]